MNAKQDPIQVEYELAIHSEDIPPSDQIEDVGIVTEIHRRLVHGDLWAWCWVEVTCTVTHLGKYKVAGVATLGGCSYADEASFREDEYFETLKHEAFEAAMTQAGADVTRGKLAAAFLRAISGNYRVHPPR